RPAPIGIRIIISEGPVAIAIDPQVTELSLLARTYRPGDSVPFFMLIGKRKRIRRDNAVTAGVLRLIHSYVGPAQDAVYRVAAFPFGDAKAAGDAEGLRLCKAQDF